MLFAIVRQDLVDTPLLVSHPLLRGHFFTIDNQEIRRTDILRGWNFVLYVDFHGSSGEYESALEWAPFIGSSWRPMALNFFEALRQHFRSAVFRDEQHDQRLVLWVGVAPLHQHGIRETWLVRIELGKDFNWHVSKGCVVFGW